MRTRDNRMNIRLTKSEAAALTRCALKFGLSKSGNIRLPLGGYVPRDKGRARNTRQSRTTQERP